MKQEDKENILRGFIEKITEDTVDMPAEIQESIDENFFELI